MAIDIPLLFAFNHGEVSKSALGRIDQQAMRLAAEEQINWQPSVLGPMTLRAGLGYLFSTHGDAAMRPIPFVFGVDDTAILMLTDQLMEVSVSDAKITAPSVATTIANGDFSSATGWTLSAIPSTAEAAISGGLLQLHSEPLGGSAYAERAVTVGAPDQNVVHRLRIVVTRGPVTFQVGSTSGAEDYFERTSLGTGTHSIAFTPTGATFYPRMSTTTRTTKNIDSIQVEGAGTFSIPAPWLAADLPYVRFIQSGDVVYADCEGYQQRQIERRDNGSWSIVLYEQTGGPYADKPSWATEVIMQPNQHNAGNGTIDTASTYFKSTHVNSLINIDCTGQQRLELLGAANEYSQPIQIEGVTTADRQFAYTISGSWVGTVTYQRSVISDTEGFVDIGTNTSNATASVDDSATHANITTWYRHGFKSGDYTSGTANILYSYQGGGGRGEARIIGINSAQEAAIEVTNLFKDVGGRKTWAPGDWSDELGWPSAVGIHDGRLFHGGRDKIWGSVSDDYLNFDELFVGDAGPINRSFGFGPFANVNWILSLNRLIVGRDASVVSIRSSSFDAPLTPTDFTMRDCSSHGTARLQAIKIDDVGIYVDKSGNRVYELAFDASKGDYADRDLTRLNIDIGAQGFVDLAVQRQPDTRIHLVRGDGLAAVLIYDVADAVVAWYRVQTDGFIENVVVLPGNQEDAVYYVVRRTINGSTKRYLERFALAANCVGGTLNYQADAYVVISQASSTTITGLSHLEAKTVVVWANGKDLGSYTVASGSITISEAVTSAIVGLSYSATFQSAKLAYAAQLGTALNQKKKIDHVGLTLLNTHYQGIEFGPDFTTMDFLPLVEEGAVTASNTMWTEYDSDPIEFQGEWHTDARLCLRATAPRPATVMAVTFHIETN